jgi:hypothetical protein
MLSILSNWTNVVVIFQVFEYSEYYKPQERFHPEDISNKT